MRKTKWIFFFYIAAVGLFVVAMAVALAFTPSRDPNTFYAWEPSEIRSFDPGDVNDFDASILLGQIYEGLYNYQYDVHPYELMPELAAAMPQISADGTVMTIPLRHGIHFYDPEKKVFPDGIGPEVKASDVIYSFKRVCDFNLASPNYSQVFEGQIVGLDDWWNYTKSTKPKDIDWDRPVAGFQAPDDYTVRLVLTAPNPQMVFNLAASFTFVVSRDAVNKWGADFLWHPVGTGPYYLKELLHEQRIVMEANPNYRGRPDIDGNTPLSASERLPQIPRLEYDYFAETVPPWILFTQGLFDVAGIPKESYNQAIRLDTGELTPEMLKKGITLTKTPDVATEYIGFNMQDPVVGKNKPLRQALSLVFDRKTYIENFLNGRGEPAIGPIPPGFPTFDPNRVNPYTCYNVALAKQKMEEAIRINHGPIPPLTLLMRDADTLSRQMAEYFAAQASQVGVTLVPEFRDFSRWQEMVDNRQTQLFDAGWVADYPDEQDFLQLFYGPNAPAGGVNSSAYINPAFDRLYDQARVMNDCPERRKLYLQMEEMVEEDCPWLLEVYPVIFRLNYNWVHNLSEMLYGYGYRQFVSIDFQSRNRLLEPK